MSSQHNSYAKLNIKTHGSFADTQQHNLPSSFKELFLKINLLPNVAQSVIIPMHVISDELNVTEHFYRLGYNFNGSTTAAVSLGITSSKIDFYRHISTIQKYQHQSHMLFFTDKNLN